jgi:hypothetical protein
MYQSDALLLFSALPIVKAKLQVARCVQGATCHWTALPYLHQHKHKHEQIGGGLSSANLWERFSVLRLVYDGAKTLLPWPKTDCWALQLCSS